MSIDPVLDEDALLSYLARTLGVEAAFASPPRPLSRGSGSSIYQFRLEGAPAGAWAGPLVLKLIVLHLGAAWIEREAAIHRFVAGRGYPAPRLLAVESAGDVLGTPFTIMERAPGVNLGRLLLGRNVAMAYRLGTLFADTHVALHRLPVEGYPEQVEGWSGDRRLVMYRDGRLGQSPEQREAFDWLESHKHAVLPEEPSVCHNNYHPVNVIVDRAHGARGVDRALGAQVIDWSNADLGDRHGDVADALVLMRTQGMRTRGARGAFERLMRAVFLRRYLRRYDQQLPLDRGRLRYWEALAAFAHQGVLAALAPAAVARQEASSSAVERRQARLARYFEERRREIEA